LESKKERDMSEKKSCVETISLAQEIERRVAYASVRLGDVLIRGIAVWRSPKGHLRVYFPSYRLGAGFDDAIRLPEDLQTEVEAGVISAYKELISEAKDNTKPEASASRRPQVSRQEGEQQ
jgi:hypothetical protein